MELDVALVKLRKANRELASTFVAGEGISTIVTPVRLGADGLLVRSAADAAANADVLGLTTLQVDSGDMVPVAQDAILELTLNSSQVLRRGAQVVLSRNLGKLCLYQDLIPGDYLYFVGYAVEDNVLQVKLIPTGIAMTNPSPPLRPAAYAANQNNVDWGSSEIVEVSASGANRSITGILAMPDGFQRLVVNIGPTYNVVLENEDAGSTAANRLHGPGVAPADLVLAPGESAGLYYSGGALNRWRMY